MEWDELVVSWAGSLVFVVSLVLPLFLSLLYSRIGALAYGP